MAQMHAVKDPHGEVEFLSKRGQILKPWAIQHRPA
jgi:hypothetical protein